MSSEAFRWRFDTVQIESAWMIATATNPAYLLRMYSSDWKPMLGRQSYQGAVEGEGEFLCRYCTA